MLHLIDMEDVAAAAIPAAAVVAAAAGDKPRKVTAVEAGGMSGIGWVGEGAPVVIRVVGRRIVQAEAVVEVPRTFGESIAAAEKAAVVAPLRRRPGCSIAEAVEVGQRPTAVAAVAAAAACKKRKKAALAAAVNRRSNAEVVARSHMGRRMAEAQSHT